MSTSPITTHVLDTAEGRPAAGIAVTLAGRDSSGAWKDLGRSSTDADGRVPDLLASGHALTPGVFRLTFQLEPYFRAKGRPGFFPEAILTFEIRDVSAHYHVPLLVSGYGYSTYRGS